MNIKLKHKLLALTVLTMLSFIITLLPAQNITAQDLSYNLTPTLLPVVSDKAGILSDYEEVTILNELTGLRNRSSFQFIFMTVADTHEYTKGNEVEAMYNIHGDDLFNTGTVLFLISTDSDNPICEMQAYNSAKDIFTNEVCSYISEKIRENIEAGSYYDGAAKFHEYCNQAYGGTLDMSDKTNAADGNLIVSYIKNHVTLIIFLAAASLLITALFYAFLFASKSKTCEKGNPGKISQESNIFAGNISYKYKLTSDRITYIRSRVTK